MGQKDHVLVRKIEGRFDVFLTIDKGFEYERDVRKLGFGIIVMTTANNQMSSYERLLPELVQQIPHASPGILVHVIDPECQTRH